MNAKEYLNQLRNLDKEINAKLDQRDYLRSMATRTSPKLLGDSSSGGNGWSNDRMADCVAKLVDLEREIDRKVDRLADLKAEAIEKIDAVENADYRLLLTLRYINGWAWEKIAKYMKYSLDHTKGYLHGQALLKIKVNTL